MVLESFCFAPHHRKASQEEKAETMSTTVIDKQHPVRTPTASPPTPARMTTMVLLAFAAVYVVWGSTYLAIRIGIESFPPLILAGLRHITVGLLLYPVLRRKTGIKPTGANWRAAVITGALLLFVGNGGVSWAERTVPSGVTALLVATVSLWLVIVDWLRPGGVKPVPRVMLGVAMQSLTGGVILLIAGLFYWRIPRPASWRNFPALLAGARLSHRFRVGHRL